MTDRRRIEPLPPRPAEERANENPDAALDALHEAIPRLPTAAIVAQAPPRLPSSAFLEPFEQIASSPEIIPQAPPPPPASTPAQAKKPGLPPLKPPPRAPRSAYVPPRLGAPIPRAQRMQHAGSTNVAQWLTSVVRTLRGMHMYADNNAQRREYFDQTVLQLEQILMETPELELEVIEDRILHQRDVVHYSPDPIDGLSAILFSNGMRRLILTRGIVRLEVLRLLGALATDFSRPEAAAEDFVSILTRLALPHIHVEGVAAPAPPAPPTQPAKPAKQPLPVVIATPEVIVRASSPGHGASRPPPERDFHSTPSAVAGVYPALREESGQGLGGALSTPAALPGQQDRRKNSIITEPITVAAAVGADEEEEETEDPGVPDPFGDDDEATFILGAPPAAPPSPPPAVHDPFEDDEATLLADSATARALAALIVEETSGASFNARARDPAEPADPADPADDAEETRDGQLDDFHELRGTEQHDASGGLVLPAADVEDTMDTGDLGDAEFGERSDTVPSLESPFAGLDDFALPEIAADLVLPTPPPPAERTPGDPRRRRPKKR